MNPVSHMIAEENDYLKTRITELKAQVVSGFYEERVPTFQQGVPTHELQEVVTAEEVTGYVAKIESILKQMGGYVIEVTELRAKLEKAREALEGISINLGTGKLRSISENLADEALALISADNVVNQIKAEAWRELARNHPDLFTYETVFRVGEWADDLLKEKT